jgi:DNA-directed RNA polymerase subunit RPC12/RpoP
MERQVVRCPSCGQGVMPGHTLCMNCGNNLLLALPNVQLPPYRCPHCGTTHPPQIVKRLTTTGWVILILGLLFLFIGALLALFFIEERRVCPICGVTVS